ncbi:MAG: CBS domain-containing protein [Patiriisocius sp.]|jgi:CBS domain-containing protein
MELKDIIKEAIVISENATFGEALDTMLTKQANSLLVVDEEGKLSGEITVTDLLDGIIPPMLDGDDAMEKLSDEAQFAEAVHDAKETLIFEFMSLDFSTVRPDDTLMDVAATAIGHQRARIPVVDHSDRPVGIISRRGLKQILGKYLHAKKS